MPPPAEPAATGLRVLFDLAAAAGAQPDERGTWHLPASLGTGFIRLLAPEPGLLLAIHHYSLRQELVLPRLAGETQPEKLLISFYAFDPTLATGLHPSSAQVTSSTVGLTTTLPAQTPIFIVALAIDKVLLASWLPDPGVELPAVLASPHPLALDMLLTPGRAAPGNSPAARALAGSLFLQNQVPGAALLAAAGTGHPPGRPHPAPAPGRRGKDFPGARRPAGHPGPAAQPSQAGPGGGPERTTLRQLFRQVFGTSPYQYYQQARLEEAAHQLPTHSVAEVDYGLGFTNLSHFARLFAQQYGLTPKKYQAAHQT